MNIWPGPEHGVRLQEVSAYKRCPLAGGVRKGRFDCICYLKIKIRKKKLFSSKYSSPKHLEIMFPVAVPLYRNGATSGDGEASWRGHDPYRFFRRSCVCPVSVSFLHPFVKAT